MPTDIVAGYQVNRPPLTRLDFDMQRTPTLRSLFEAAARVLATRRDGRVYVWGGWATPVCIWGAGDDRDVTRHLLQHRVHATTEGRVAVFNCLSSLGGAGSGGAQPWYGVLVGVYAQGAAEAPPVEWCNPIGNAAYACLAGDPVLRHAAVCVGMHAGGARDPHHVPHIGCFGVDAHHRRATSCLVDWMLRMIKDGRVDDMVRALHLKRPTVHAAFMAFLDEHEVHMIVMEHSVAATVRAVAADGAGAGDVVPDMLDCAVWVTPRDCNTLHARLTPKPPRGGAVVARTTKRARCTDAAAGAAAPVTRAAPAAVPARRTQPSRPTTHRNTTFQSRLEARYAYVFDRLGIEYSYETIMVTCPAMNDLIPHQGSRAFYKPDFHLPGVGVTVEVKPNAPTREEVLLCVAFAKAYNPIVLLYGGSASSNADHPFRTPFEERRKYGGGGGVPSVPTAMLYTRDDARACGVRVEGVYLGRTSQHDAWSFVPVCDLYLGMSADDFKLLEQAHEEALEHFG